MENINWEQMFYYDDLAAYARYLSSHYKGIVEYEVIGRSLDNRDIFMLKAGTGKKNVILTGGVHGRESINPMVLLSMVEYYCEEMLDYLDQISLSIVPLVNPDGYSIALQGYNCIRNDYLYEQLKQKECLYQEWKKNCRGVDINRNFPAKSWKKKFSDDYPGSEPETQVLMKLFCDVPSCGYIDFHSRGEEIYYYRNALSVEYNEEQIRLAKLLAALTDYQLVPSVRETEVGDSGGNTVQFYSEMIKKPAFTVETVENEAVFPLSSHYQRNVFERIKMTPFIFMEN